MRAFAMPCYAFSLLFTSLLSPSAAATPPPRHAAMLTVTPPLLFLPAGARPLSDMPRRCYSMSFATEGNATSHNVSVEHCCYAMLRVAFSHPARHAVITFSHFMTR